jgi:hypothetical protein
MGLVGGVVIKQAARVRVLFDMGIPLLDLVPVEVGDRSVAERSIGGAPPNLGSSKLGQQVATGAPAVVVQLTSTPWKEPEPACKRSR